jgi:hypothetical protein
MTFPPFFGGLFEGAADSGDHRLQDRGFSQRRGNAREDAPQRQRVLVFRHGRDTPHTS